MSIGIKSISEKPEQNLLYSAIERAASIRRFSDCFVKVKVVPAIN
jgi:hypothetical protein